MGQNTHREWTVGTVLDISLGPHNDIGGRLRVGELLGRDIMMTVGPMLGILMVPTDSVGYGPVEGTQ